MRQAEAKMFSAPSVAGLEVETDERLRGPNSWQRLDNWDLFIPGAIRKVRGFTLLNEHEYDAPIVSIREYRRRPGEEPLILGVSVLGTIYNLVTGADLAHFPVVNYPFVGIMSWFADGVSSPLGTPNPAKQTHYLISTTAGYYASKWDGLFGITTVLGVEAPKDPAEVTMVIASSPDLPTMLPGIAINIQRAYAWTWWNPTTRHESSMSPVGADSVVDPTKFPFLEAKSNIRQIRLRLPGINPGYGDGYSRRRIYARRDGGEEMLLLTDLPGADSDESISAAQLEVLDGEFDPYAMATDDGTQIGYIVIGGLNSLIWGEPGIGIEVYFDLMQPGVEFAHSVYPTVNIPIPALPVPEGTTVQQLGGIAVPVPGSTMNNVPPRSDATLVEPGPKEGENDPPPPAIWGAIYQGRLWLVDAEDQSRLVFSKVLDFQSFPIDNYFNIDSDNFDPITSLISKDISLVVGKQRSMIIISGSSFADFTNLPLDPQIGVSGSRCITSSEGRVFFISQKGIVRLEANVPSFDGHLIRPYSDELNIMDVRERACAAINTKQDLIYFVFPTQTIHGESQDSLMLLDLSQQSPFSRIVNLPCNIFSLQNVLFPSTTEEYIKSGKSEIVLAGTADKKVYMVGIGTDIGNGPVVAVAETQLIPQDDPDSRKVFRRLYVAAKTYSGLMYSYAVDGGAFTTPIQVQLNNFLGVVGKQIVIRFQHEDAIQDDLVLTRYEVEYVDIGEAR